MKRPLLPVVVVGILPSAYGGGSSSTSPSSQPATTTFRGTIAGTGDESGTLEITVQTVLGSSFSWVPSAPRAERSVS